MRFAAPGWEGVGVGGDDESVQLPSELVARMGDGAKEAEEEEEEEGGAGGVGPRKARDQCGGCGGCGGKRSHSRRRVAQQMLNVLLLFKLPRKASVKVEGDSGRSRTSLPPCKFSHPV
ncbi:unnamed protein product [Sphagnum jensenii]